MPKRPEVLAGLTQGQKIQVQTMTELELQGAVSDAAMLLGWTVKHIRDSRGQDWVGMPDLLVYRLGVCFWVELKRFGQVATPIQLQQIIGLREAGQKVYVWTPLHWVTGEIEAVLNGDIP